MFKRDSVILDVKDLRMKWATEDVERAMQTLAETIDSVEPTGDMLRVVAAMTDYVTKLNIWMSIKGVNND